jgi:opacity protein-like surface antigen
MKRSLLAALLCACLAPAAHAQDSLGFSGFDLGLRHARGDTDISSVDLRGTVHITAVHGLQLDLGASDIGAYWRGGIAAHLFMAPSAKAKYGLFAAINDTNGFADTEYSLGAELIASCGPGCEIEARAGIGTLKPGSNDYIFGRLAGRYALGPQLRAKLALDVIDIEEMAYSARETRLSAGFDYALSDRLSLDLGVEHARYSGTSPGDDTRLTLGLTTRFGAQGQPFSPVRPIEGLLAHGATPLAH